MSLEAVANPQVEREHGAGIQAAQLIANEHARFVATGRCGPNALKILSAAGLSVITGCTGTVREVVEQWKAGGCAVAQQPVRARELNIGSESPMKVAVPDWQGRVSPVFDVAECLLLVDLDREGEGQRQTERLATSLPHERARRLAELGVDVLLCGAISWSLEALLARSGIRVISLVCGAVDEVVAAFREGTLEQGDFAMPGCCRSRRRGCDRRRRRHGGQISEDSA